MAYKNVILEKNKAVGIIRLNTPDNRNALSQKLCIELADCVETMEKDDDVKAVIVTGTEKSFCSGVDLKEMAETVNIMLRGGPLKETLFGPNLREDKESLLMINYRINKMSKPTIAAVNGAAIGAGVSMALACDMRVASESARFQIANVKRGVIPDVGGTYFLPHVLGIAKACEVAFIADPIGAAEALEKGMVNRVVPDSELMNTAMEMATKIAGNSPLAVKMTKQALYQALFEPDLLHHMRHEIIINRVLLDAEDFREGVLSYIEKRECRFTGKWR